MNEKNPTKVELWNLSIRQKERLLLDQVTLSLAAGETLAILGPSGCGKTTLLRAIAGLVPVEEGSITIGGRRVEKLATHERGIIYLGQEPLLFPHLDVFENIAFGLHMRGDAGTKIEAMVHSMITQLELEGLAGRSPHALSGGQRQRVAFGRALILSPPLLLLDEPFSSLDPETRFAMQRLFKQLAHTHRCCAIFVTHDLKEALGVGDRLAVVTEQSLRLYENHDDFCSDPNTGVIREAQYWNQQAWLVQKHSDS